MAPKQKFQKFSLQEFQENESFGNVPGSWADDDLPLTFERPTATSTTNAEGWTVRDRNDYRGGEVPIPDSAPFTARLVNLDYDATEDAIKELFSDPKFKVLSIRVPRDQATGRLRGYAFVEFEDRESLVNALELSGTTLVNRAVRIVVAEKREDDKFSGDWRNNASGPLGGGRREEDADNRDYSDWSRRGPLPPRDDRPRRRSRPDDDRNYENWAERRGPLPGGADDAPRRRQYDDDGKVRDFENWERRGPPPDRRREAPFTDADKASDWRRTGGAGAGAGAGGSRKKLDLKPRTVGAHAEVPAAAEGGRSPFGSAKPVDTTKKLIEVGEKYEKLEHDKIEAERKHREERDEEKRKKEDFRDEQMRKRFEVLKVDDEDEPEASPEPTENAKAQAIDDTAEKAPVVEASSEELETGEWNVVNKRGRK